MSFWEKALGTAPAAPQPRSEAPVGHWSTPAPLVPQQPVQQPQAMPQPVPLAQPQPDLSKAQSARSNRTCPECGSGNIFKPHGVPNAMEQCYGCGWNPRFAQSMAGAGITNSTGPATPSKQISTSNNYNPQVVVGKVS